MIGLATLIFAGFAIGAPTLFERGTTVSVITPATISTYAPYASLSSAAYCSTASTWTCAQCKNLPGFVPYATGGDGDSVPKWYVGWWPTQSTVVVGHQGTNPAQLESLLTDAEVVWDTLSSPLFPGVSSSVKVWALSFSRRLLITRRFQAHDGFMKAQAATATTILASVKYLLNAHSANKVLATGHSLGGAIATLDALYFKLNLPSTTSIKAVTFGLPRMLPPVAPVVSTRGARKAHPPQSLISSLIIVRISSIHSEFASTLNTPPPITIFNLF
ncbi:hypothetical protein RSOLAG1IB_04758 [Rhizoctonia solani AG-1 IB]|uniref:Fungal lipase-type domain-containing protein n=1 Tax=Thanatephorus cucumeris (strain AG1-IB / isolate 7/3/14) TaxID=1108050 RepID=A0A0B7G0N8_THACB|nr:hypothetical protein RSOLAG1IB_04758 [Rhizoctonia solani AG-1 IB]